MTKLHHILKVRPISPYLLMTMVALFLTISANITFFRQAIKVYPLWENGIFVASLAVVLFGLLLLIIALSAYRYTLRGVLIILIMLGAISSYFTDTYGVIYDTTMIQNALQTNTQETLDLLNWGFFWRIMLLGILPSVLVAIYPTRYPRMAKSMLMRFGVILLSLALIALPIGLMSKKYASFFRVHKPIRFYTNPTTPIYAVSKLAHQRYQLSKIPKQTIMHAQDAIKTTGNRRPRLMIFVVGEAVRADHIMMNGYHRNTLPQMQALANQGELSNFSQVLSCGTSTAYSVPCMFGYLGADKFDLNLANYQENALDTLHRLGVNIVWRDNNSDSKGVMDKLPNNLYQDYKSQDANPHCQNNANECRDSGMLVGLDKLVADDGRDMLIVLHQMGNHGPAYFRRYDDKFAQFTPICQNNDLAQCDRDHIVNAYDNALLATDDFLAKAIDFLKTYEGDFETALLYVSDHGESLGENGIYLHGIPYAIAPIAQKHVPAFFWQSKNSHFVPADGDASLSHDAITPTLLTFFDVQTDAIKDKKALITR